MEEKGEGAGRVQPIPYRPTSCEKHFCFLLVSKGDGAIQVEVALLNCGIVAEDAPVLHAFLCHVPPFCPLLCFSSLRCAFLLLTFFYCFLFIAVDVVVFFDFLYFFCFVFICALANLLTSSCR